MVQMVRESAENDYLANSGDFMREFEVSRRTVARDLDFLRDEENAPLAYDEARHGYVLTDETYALPPVSISRKEAFSFGLARKLLAHYDGTPLHLDMKAVLDKIAESLEGEVTLEPDWLSEHVDVLPEDRVRIDPDLWGSMVGFVERREAIQARYQTFDGRESDYRLHPYHLLAYHGNFGARGRMYGGMAGGQVCVTLPDTGKQAFDTIEQCMAATFGGYAGRGCGYAMSWDGEIIIDNSQGPKTWESGAKAGVCERGGVGGGGGDLDPASGAGGGAFDFETVLIVGVVGPGEVDLGSGVGGSNECGGSGRRRRRIAGVSRIGLAGDVLDFRLGEDTVVNAQIAEAALEIIRVEGGIGVGSDDWIGRGGKNGPGAGAPHENPGPVVIVMPDRAVVGERKMYPRVQCGRLRHGVPVAPAIAGEGHAAGGEYQVFVFAVNHAPP